MLYFPEEGKEMARKRKFTFLEYADEIESEYDHDEGRHEAQYGRKHETHAKGFSDESKYPTQYGEPDKSSGMEEYEWFLVFLVVLGDFCREREDESTHDRETARKRSNYSYEEPRDRSHRASYPEIQYAWLLEYQEKTEKSQSDGESLPQDAVILFFPFDFFRRDYIPLWFYFLRQDSGKTFFIGTVVCLQCHLLGLEIHSYVLYVRFLF